MAGTLSERLFLGRATTGAADDLANARRLARDMVIRFGMGPRLGLMCPALPEGACSEKLMRSIEDDVSRLLRTAIRTATATLRHRTRLVRRIAETLLARRTLTGRELDGVTQLPNTSLSME